MKIIEGINFTKNEMFNLYENVGWTSYLNNKNELWESIQKSLLVVCCVDNDEILGYARILGDGINTILIQDIIVKIENRRKGIGLKLVKYVLNKYHNVRQVFLICDEDEYLYKFYHKCGFSEINNFGTKCFAVIK